MNLIYALSAYPFGKLSDRMSHSQLLAIALVILIVADSAPADLRGTAYGFFNLMSGIALLIASTVAGLLWDKFGPAFTFYAGAGFCVITLVGLVWQPSHAK